jgi:hypothetical protein
MATAARSIDDADLCHTAIVYAGAAVAETVGCCACEHRRGMNGSNAPQFGHSDYPLQFLTAAGPLSGRR